MCMCAATIEGGHYVRDVASIQINVVYKYFMLKIVCAQNFILWLHASTHENQIHYFVW